MITKDFRRLKVWEKAHQLAIEAYHTTASFPRIAMGSASELEHEFLLAHDLGFMAETGYKHLSESVMEIKRMLTSLIKKLRAEG
jgi:hypothetical protein